MDNIFAEMIAREWERLARMRGVRRHALVRLRALRRSVRAARLAGDTARAAEQEADRETIVRGLVWLRHEERALAARLAFLGEQSHPAFETGQHAARRRE